MSSVQKTMLLAGILIIIGGGAFVYFDPLDLDLLGLKQKPAAAKPAMPHVASSKAVTSPPTKAPVAVPSPAPSPVPATTPPVAATKVAAAPALAKAPVAATPSAPSPTAVTAATPAATQPVVETAQAPQPPMKLSQEAKAASKPAANKPERPKNLDLRHCLELETNAAIAKCAGE